MSAPIKFRHLRPDQIQIPEIRVTSIWTEEEYEEFQSTIEANGIGNPIKCVKEGETWWLVDGKHRLEEALRLGYPKIPVAYSEGSLLEAMLKNLYLNRQRGRTPASDEVKLIQYLMNEKGMGVAEIARRTGLSQKRIEQRLQIGSASPYVLTALETEQIGVGVAYQLSRLPGEEGQNLLLGRLLMAVPPATTEEVMVIVDESLRLREEAKRERVPPPDTIPVRTLSCHLCGQHYEPGNLRGINVCITCHGLARDWIQRRLKAQTERISPADALAQKIARGELSAAEKAELEERLRR